MNHETTHRSLTVTVLLLAAAAVLWGAVVAVLAFVVPSYGRAFRNQNLILPDAVLAVLAVGRWAASYWYVLPLFGLLILPVLILLTWLLRHRATERWPGWVWFGALLGVPVLLQLVIWWALLLLP